MSTRNLCAWIAKPEDSVSTSYYENREITTAVPGRVSGPDGVEGRCCPGRWTQGAAVLLLRRDEGWKQWGAHSRAAEIRTQRDKKEAGWERIQRLD